MLTLEIHIFRTCEVHIYGLMITAGLSDYPLPSPPNQELGILKGQLSRWLLPFNTDTSVDEQQAATPRRFQESLLASSATSGTAGGGSGGTLTEEEAEYLTAGARRVRQLVRKAVVKTCQGITFSSGH